MYWICTFIIDSWGQMVKIGDVVLTRIKDFAFGRELLTWHILTIQVHNDPI